MIWGLCIPTSSQVSPVNEEIKSCWYNDIARPIMDCNICMDHIIKVLHVDGLGFDLAVKNPAELC